MSTPEQQLRELATKWTASAESPEETTARLARESRQQGHDHRKDIILTCVGLGVFVVAFLGACYAAWASPDAEVRKIAVTSIVGMVGAAGGYAFGRKA